MSRDGRTAASGRTTAAGTLTIAGALTIIAAGCSFAPRASPPETVAGMPGSYAADEVAGERDAVRWWRTFDDPALDRLVDTALVANLDLREAFGRLEELRNRYRIARAPLFPAISANADVTRSSTPGNTGIGGSFGADGEAPDSSGFVGFQLADRFEFTTYSASLGFSYELDFWGRLRNESSAAVHEFLASRADLATVQLTVIGATISTYLELVTARAQRRLAAENVDLLRERAELTESRYRRGLIGSFELYTIRQQFRTAESELPGLRTAVEDAEGRLAVLLGRYAGAIAALVPEAADPAVDTAGIAASLPVRLLESRPDVWAAAERVESARLRVGARRAELLPTISLNGSVGLQSSGPEDLFRADQWFLNFVGGIVAPIFQGGRLRANVGVAEAQYEQAAAAYVRTVLTAYYEVRTSLIRYDNERERLASVGAQVADAEASLDLQLQRYRRGVGDYVSYLDARRNLVTARQVLALAERAVGEARLAVHRALGGAWIREEERVTERTDPERAPAAEGAGGPPAADRRER